MKVLEGDAAPPKDLGTLYLEIVVNAVKEPTVFEAM